MELVKGIGGIFLLGYAVYLFIQLRRSARATERLGAEMRADAARLRAQGEEELAASMEGMAASADEMTRYAREQSSFSLQLEPLPVILRRFQGYALATLVELGVTLLGVHFSQSLPAGVGIALILVMFAIPVTGFIALVYGVTYLLRRGKSR